MNTHPTTTPVGGSLARLVRHAEGEIEHSLCGVAFDAYSSGDWPTEVVFAKAGETVTCPECCAHIDFVRSQYRHYRYVPNDKVSSGDEPR